MCNNNNSKSKESNNILHWQHRYHSIDVLNILLFIRSEMRVLAFCCLPVSESHLSGHNNETKGHTHYSMLTNWYNIIIFFGFAIPVSLCEFACVCVRRIDQTPNELDHFIVSFFLLSFV